MSTNGQASVHPSTPMRRSSVPRWAVLFVLLAGAFFALAYYLSNDIRDKVRANPVPEVRE